jgi:deazaflavin-dependent oxidoreductase (nitroreductase family)
VAQGPAAFGFAARATEGEQYRDAPAGGGEEPGVAVELFGQAARGLGAVVVLEEEADPPVGFCPLLIDMGYFGMASGGRLQRTLEKYLFNPPNRLLLRLGIAPRAFALLETKGRRTGQARLTPVGNGLDGSVFWIVAEHGTSCDYVKNLLANPKVRLKVGRRWYSGTASVIHDDDSLGRRRVLDQKNGVVGRADGVIFRASASEPVTVRVDLA